MSKEYKKVIIAVVSIMVIITAVILFYTYKSNLTSEEKKLFSLPKGTELTEEQQTKYDGAINGLEQDSQNINFLVDIAQIKYDILDLDGSIEVYKKVLEIQPDHLVTLNNLGDIYNQKKEYDKAAQMYLTIIQTTPKWVNAYRELGYIYKYHFPEKYPDMVDLLLNGIEKVEEFGGEASVDFYSMLAVIYDETNQIDKAIEYYEKVLELTPNDERVKIRIEELKQLK
jgi:tetratricopeptide (TPR) repeat protein